MGFDELDLERHKINLVGAECQVEWSQLTLEQQENVFLAILNIQRTGLDHGRLNFAPIDNVYGEMDRVARDSFRYHQVPDNVGLYVVVAVHKGDNPGVDVFGIVPSGLVAPTAGEKTAIKERIAKLPEAWGLPEETRPHSVKQSVRKLSMRQEISFPYDPPKGPSQRRHGPAKEEVPWSVLVQEIRDLMDLAVASRFVLPKSEIRDFFTKLDAILVSAWSYYPYYGSERKGLDDQSRRFSIYNQEFLYYYRFVSKNIVRLPSPTVRDIYENENIFMRDIGYFRTDVGFGASKWEKKDEKKLSALVQEKLAPFFPDADSFRLLGVDSGSSMSAFNLQGYSRDSPFHPMIYRNEIIPALRDLQRSNYEHKGPIPNVPDYLIDDRKKTRLTIPPGMIRITPIGRFQMFTVQTNQRIFNEPPNHPNERYQSIVLGFSGPLQNTIKISKDYKKYLNKVEKMLLEDAKNQGLSVKTILNPENCPFLVNGAVDPGTGITWREVRDVRAVGLTPHEVSVFSQYQDWNRATKGRGETYPSPISETELAELIGKVRMRHESPDVWKAPPLIENPISTNTTSLTEGEEVSNDKSKRSMGALRLSDIFEDRYSSGTSRMGETEQNKGRSKQPEERFKHPKSRKRGN